MDHIIRRQLLELTLDGHQPPFDLQNRLSDQYYQTLLPVLEKWFDQLAGEDEVLFIDRLVLDLGVFSRRDFDDRLLKQRLIEKLGSPDITRAMVERVQTARHPVLQGGIQRRSARHNAFEQWIWYMENGYLPWSLLRVTPEWEYKVLETLATDYPAITRLRSLLTNHPTTLTRIALQHDDIFLMRLTEILTTVVQSPLPQTLQELRRLLIFAVNLETSNAAYLPLLTIPTPEKAWQDTLMLAASLGKESDTKTLTHRLLTHYWAEYTKFLPELQDYLATHPIARDLVEPLPSALPKLPDPETSALPKPPDPDTSALPKLPDPDTSSPPDPDLPRLSGPGAPVFPTSDAPVPPDPGTPETPGILKSSVPFSSEPGCRDPMQSEPSRGEQDSAASVGQGQAIPGVIMTSAGFDPAFGKTPVKAILVPPAIPTHLRIEQLPEEGLFLLNAGVILTHPFLSHLFKLSGLLVSGKFIAHGARQKAIHLLHYLATGRTVAGEFELTTAKILCGCPLEYPIEKQSVITAEELKEADSLLEGVISHWGVKNITVEGLRGNFLTRSGKLSPKNDMLQLVIEKHAVDILVRTYPFPWNMSIIRLPWLNTTIQTDW